MKIFFNKPKGGFALKNQRKKGEIISWVIIYK